MGKVARLKKEFAYLKHYDCDALDGNMILLESQQGRTLNGNIFYLTKELAQNREYSSYKLVMSYMSDKKRDFESLLSKYHISGVELVEVGSVEYRKALCRAKYLITDMSFPTYFMKKEGQIILNVWHGTFVKTLGRSDAASNYLLGNVQKNFFLSDYLLYPCNYIMDIMVRDYMLENLSRAECVLSGLPRNEAFFRAKNPEILKSLGKDKRIIAYMPTWRGLDTFNLRQSENEIIQGYLSEIDEGLSGDDLLMVKLHPFIGDSISYDSFNHIVPFPKVYETYDVLNCCDILITDYSSLVSDFSVTGRKVILFAYDLEQYAAERGFYFSLEELPFPMAVNVQEIMREINSPISYDAGQFHEKFCKYECGDASAKLLRHVILEDRVCVSKDMPSNGRDNILIYSGGLSKNGITAALMNLLKNVDLDAHNYFLHFMGKTDSDRTEIVKSIPSKVGYIPSRGKMNLSLIQKVMFKICRKDTVRINCGGRLFDRACMHEIKRCFGDIPFSTVIQYSGYNLNKQLLFGRFKSSRRMIYVHSDMVGETTVRKEQNKNALRYAYNAYDKVVMITEGMRTPTLAFCYDESKLKVAGNIIDYRTIVEKAGKLIFFDADSVCSVSNSELTDILDGDKKVFITIGRFSPEKAHKRLIDAFDRLYSQHQDCKLIILGGHGPLYEDTIKYKDTKECGNSIIIMQSISNPYPILKMCDYFILPSLYEGLGLVAMEADVLGVPAVCTDIPGPRSFFLKYGGTLVDNSCDGVYDGLCKLYNGQVAPMNVDYREYNYHAVKQFESLLKR